MTSEARRKASPTADGICVYCNNPQAHRIHRDWEPEMPHPFRRSDALAQQEIARDRHEAFEHYESTIGQLKQEIARLQAQLDAETDEEKLNSEVYYAQWKKAEQEIAELKQQIIATAAPARARENELTERLLMTERRVAQVRPDVLKEFLSEVFMPYDDRQNTQGTCAVCGRNVPSAKDITNEKCHDDDCAIRSLIAREEGKP